MRKLLVPLFGMAIMLALVALVRPVAAAPSFQRTDLEATLRGGAEEVPNPGDPDGTGAASVILDTSLGQACYGINVSNITLPAAASHIHEGAAGVAGPVVVPFTAPDASGASSGCVAVEADLMQRIMQNPAGFYVNVHTSDFPGGAVRGQLAMSSGPAQMPGTGAGSGSMSRLAGLALLALVAGLGLSLSSRRRASTR